MAQRIFVSYARVDQDFALRLAKALRGFGFDIWIDQLDIAAGKRWDREIEVALEACPAFLLVMSPASVASDNVMDEVNFALEHGKEIVPVLYQPCNVPFRVRRFQHVDFTGDETAALAAFGSRLQRLKDVSGPTSKKDAPSPSPRASTEGAGDWQRLVGSVRLPPPEPPSPDLEDVDEWFLPKGQFRVLVGPKGQEQEHSLKPGDSIRDLPDSPEMVLMPPGKFWMGSTQEQLEKYVMCDVALGYAEAASRAGWRQEGPQHMVEFVQPFAVGKFAVTFDEWESYFDGARQAVLRPLRSLLQGSQHKPRDFGWGRGLRPVIEVSWRQAKEYVAWLSSQTGRAYRLLSEAEWEYCARSGATIEYAFGDFITTEQANFNGRSSYDKTMQGANRRQTIEVGTFKANAFGLYDMHGNVRELCEDVWVADYNGAPTDGSARGSSMTSGFDVVVRGGSHGDAMESLRSANRAKAAYGPDGFDEWTGFRVARTIE